MQTQIHFSGLLTFHLRATQHDLTRAVQQKADQLKHSRLAKRDHQEQIGLARHSAGPWDNFKFDFGDNLRIGQAMMTFLSHHNINFHYKGDKATNRTQSPKARKPQRLFSLTDHGCF